MNTDEFLSLFYRLPIKTNTKTAEHVVCRWVGKLNFEGREGGAREPLGKMRRSECTGRGLWKSWASC